MARALLLLLLLPLAAGFDAWSGRPVVAERGLEAMIPIAAGRFRIGATEDDVELATRLCQETIGAGRPYGCQKELFLVELPDRTVFVSAFSIDRVEVTVDAYRRCVRAGGCAPDPIVEQDPRLLHPDLPMTSVTWNEAVAFCAWRGARLPTEAEWERAARGQDGRRWPWGRVPREDLSNHGRFHLIGQLSPLPMPVIEADASDGFALLAPVGSFRQGASPDGVLDMAGNASEWTADAYDETAPQLRTSVNPRGPRVGPYRVLRGGSWRTPIVFQRTTWRDPAPPDLRSPEVGFRCAK